MRTGTPQDPPRVAYSGRMTAFALVIAITVVVVAALIVVGLAVAVWLGIAAMRPELLEKTPRQDLTRPPAP